MDCHRALKIAGLSPSLFRCIPCKRESHVVLSLRQRMVLGTVQAVVSIAEFLSDERHVAGVAALAVALDITDSDAILLFLLSIAKAVITLILSVAVHRYRSSYLIAYILMSGLLGRIRRLFVIVTDIVGR